MADFYLNERSLAAYVEKDWADHFISPGAGFAFAGFPQEFLYSDYHERSVALLASTTGGVPPVRGLEVGSSLGRTFYEVCRQLPSVRQMTLIEPSQNLLGTFEKIFASEAAECSLPILKGNVQTGEARLPAAKIREVCRGVERTCLNSSFMDLPLDEVTYDLVICSNVIDQTKDPERLVEFLKSKTAPGGVLLLSCTYQWQNKYIGNASKQIMNINDLFGAGWSLQAETNIPFNVRLFERHWLNFLSHVSVFRLN